MSRKMKVHHIFIDRHFIYNDKNNSIYATKIEQFELERTNQNFEDHKWCTLMCCIALKTIQKGEIDVNLELNVLTCMSS